MFNSPLQCNLCHERFRDKKQEPKCYKQPCENSDVMHPAFTLWISMMLFLKNSDLLKGGPLALTLLNAAEALDPDSIELLAMLDHHHTSLCNERAELERQSRAV